MRWCCLRKLSKLFTLVETTACQSWRVFWDTVYIVENWVDITLLTKQLDLDKYILNSIIWKFVPNVYNTIVKRIILYQNRHYTVCFMFFNDEDLIRPEAMQSQRDRATLHDIEYFAKSLEVSHTPVLSMCYLRIVSLSTCLHLVTSAIMLVRSFVFYIKLVCMLRECSKIAIWRQFYLRKSAN